MKHYVIFLKGRKVLFSEIEVYSHCPLDIVAIRDQYHAFNNFIYDGIHYGKIEGPLETLYSERRYKLSIDLRALC